MAVKKDDVVFLFSFISFISFFDLSHGLSLFVILHTSRVLMWAKPRGDEAVTLYVHHQSVFMGEQRLRRWNSHQEKSYCCLISLMLLRNRSERLRSWDVGKRQTQPEPPQVPNHEDKGLMSGKCFVAVTYWSQIIMENVSKGWVLYS